MKNEYVLVKCIYAPNKDRNNTSPENESNTFFKKVFDDSNEEHFTHKIIVDDYNVAVNHDIDTLGNLRINNPNSRDYPTRKSGLCNMVDIWRLKNPNIRQ